MLEKQLHVERIKPEFSVSDGGLISWKASLTDYDASLFYRGKTVSNEEFNELFLNKTFQSNYIVDSLTEFFKVHLPESLVRTFKTHFELRESFVKTFDTNTWRERQADGYYYITIPASEHGITLPEDQSAIEGMNVDTEMYLLDAVSGTFYEVTQVETDTANTVKLYTDDNTLSGFVVIRTNDKAFTLAEARIDVTQINGLADVAKSGNYADLKFKPDEDIKANRDALNSILSDTAPRNGYAFVHNADHASEAEYATHLLGSGTIQNQPISSIFEEGSSWVKNASYAKNAKYAEHAAQTTTARFAEYADSDTEKGTIEERLGRLGKTIKTQTFTNLADTQAFVMQQASSVLYVNIVFKQLIYVNNASTFAIKSTGTMTTSTNGYEYVGGSIRCYPTVTGNAVAGLGQTVHADYQINWWDPEKLKLTRSSTNISYTGVAGADPYVGFLYYTKVITDADLSEATVYYVD